MKRLYGMTTGLNDFDLLSRIEENLPDVDWELSGSLDEPWPPDVWVEGNNGRDALRVNYKGDRHEFRYGDYVHQFEFERTRLADDVIRWVRGKIAADPDPVTEARIQHYPK